MTGVGSNEPVLLGRDLDGRPAGAHHQHAASHINHLVIEIHADDRVGADLGGLLRHLVKGDALGAAKLLLTRSTASSACTPATVPLNTAKTSGRLTSSVMPT